MQIEKLEHTARTKEIVEKLNEVIEVLQSAPKDRRQRATREMTEDDARRVVIGDLKMKSHKEAAEELDLTYGQVYSARRGYTFTKIYEEWRASGNDRRKTNEQRH